MDSKLVESHLEYIAGKVVDEDKIVTYKSLSRNLNVHVNTAKQLLHIYLANEKSRNTFPISATYLISGKVIDGSFNISIVNESELKDAHSKLVQVTSEHVYSVQKGRSLKEIKCLYGVNKEARSESSAPVIKHPKNVLKQRQQVSRKSEFNEAENKKIIKKALVPTKETVVTESNEKIETVTTDTSHKKTSPKKNSEKAQASVKKPTGSIANLFAKANQKNAEKSAKADLVKNEPKSVISNENIRDEKFSKKEPPKRRSASKESLNRKIKGNKRKRIQMVSDSEESEDDDEEEEEKMDIDLEEKPSPSPVSKNIEEEEEMEEIKESGFKNKRKKRKMIDKTVMNEDGYLETKKEIVYETDSENETTEEVIKPKEDKKPKVEKSKDVKVGKKQSSLLSFFNKKG